MVPEDVHGTRGVHGMIWKLKIHTDCYHWHQIVDMDCNHRYRKVYID